MPSTMVHLRSAALVASLRFRKLIEELVALECSRMAEVQVSRCFELDTLRAGISSGAVPTGSQSWLNFITNVRT
jgi:hypothetical protein